MWFVDGVVGVGVFGGEVAGEALYGGWDLDRVSWMEGEEIWECRICVSWMEANFSAWNELYIQSLKKRRILHAKSQQSQH